MKNARSSFLLLLVLFATQLESCHVESGPLELKPEKQSNPVDEQIRQTIVPSLNSILTSVQTFGYIYKATSGLSEIQHVSEPNQNIYSFSDIFRTSSEDSLVVTQQNMNLQSENIESSSKTSESYNFTYSLVNASTMSLPDPNFKLSIETKGNIDVVEGKPQFHDVKVIATITSKNNSMDPVIFTIATMRLANADATQNYSISIEAFKHLIQKIQNIPVEDQQDARGNIELTVSKTEAKLDVTNILLENSSKLTIESLSGTWNFKDKSLVGNGKLSFLANNKDILGIDLDIDSTAKISTKVWKRDMNH